MARRVALVSRRSYPPVAQIVFSTKGVMVGVSCGLCPRERGQVHTAGGRQIVGAKRHDGIRIWSIPRGRMDV